MSIALQLPVTAVDASSYDVHPRETAPIELSVVLPCLNEAETLGMCIRKAQRALRHSQIRGEVIVADNGSTDGSLEIAEELGARIVHASEKGYGNALMAGISAARGLYVVMGDADDSYDFLQIPRFLGKLREGYDLVMGNRFRGGIMPGAMPWKHRWIGNPVLTGIGRLLFRCPAGDFHCGLRGFSRRAYEKMELQTTGMEFASEMVIKATLKGLAIAEVPTTLHKDGRSRPPHLRSWRDGWRHLRFMLLYSPLWLFFVPGATMLLTGLVACLWLLGGPRHVGPVELDVHTLLVAGFVSLVGYELITFAGFTKIFAVVEGLHPPSRLLNRLFQYVNLEVGVALGLASLGAGFVCLFIALQRWAHVGLGALEPTHAMRWVIPAILLMLVGIQTVFSSFFLSILGLKRRQRTPSRTNGES